MKSLDTLIRLKQEHLDQKRLVLSRLENEISAIQGRIELLEAEVACETEAARGDAEAGYGFGTYLASARRRRSGLEARLAQVQEAVAEAAEEVADAFREMKRFELAQSFAAQRAAAEAARREQAHLDDVGLAGYRRRKALAGS